MQAEQFLDRIEHHGLLDDEVIQDLREQVRASQGRATPDAIAKLLVENGYLTQLQANKIMDELAAAPAAPRPTQAQPKEEIVALEEAEPSPPPPPSAPSGLTELPNSSAGLTELPASTGLDPLGGGLGDPLTGDLGGATPMAGTPTMGGPRRFGRRGNQWDSKYLLVGGGALLMICLAGVFMFFSLTRGNAAEFFKKAEEEYRDERYSQAIESYDKFLKKFPKDENASTAKVKRGMCRLRIVVGNSTNPNQMLETAHEILPTIEEEDAFSSARVELADLLPQIAEKFVDAAEKANGDQAKELVAKTKECMEKLVRNPSYIPSKMMRNLDTRLEPIQERLTEVERDIERGAALIKLLADVSSAITDGNTRGANESIKNTIGKYPRLEAHKDVLQAAKSIAAKEKELVKVEKRTIEATTEDRKQTNEVVPSSTTGKKVAELENQVAFVLAKGAAYGLDMSSGKVLWRRFVGNDARGFDPVKIGPQGDALLMDQQNKEIVRVNARSGKLVWRLVVGEELASCAVGEDRVLVSTRTGRIIQIDPKTGNSPQFVTLPINLTVAPALDAKRPQIYQVGDHSNLYALDRESLQCSEVVYLGHKAGTVDVPPILHLGHVFICENRGETFSYLWVFQTDKKGLNVKRAGQPIRLPGKVVVPPIIYGRRVLVVTDMGHVRMFKLEVDDKGVSTVTTMFALPPREQKAKTGYPIAFEGQLWLGDTSMTRYQIQLARGRFSETWGKFRGDTFVAPMQRFGNVLLHVRQPKGSTGVTVSTIEPRSGSPIWETRLAVPGNVRVGSDGNVEALSAAGDLYNLGSGLSGGVATPTHSAKVKTAAAFTETIDLGDGRVVLAPNKAARQIVLYSPKANNKMRLVELSTPGTSSAAPIAFANGIVMPMSNGQVFLVDPATGKQLAHPFQPRLEATNYYHWSRPVRLPGNEFAVCNKAGTLHVVTLRKTPTPHLGLVVSLETKQTAYRPLVSIGDVVFIVRRDKTNDEIVTYQRNETDDTGFVAGKKFTLKGRVGWGPIRVGNQIFIAGDVDGLTCLDAEKQVWQIPLTHGHLAGPPIPEGGDFLLTTTNGVVARISGTTGAAIGKPVQLTEPLGSGSAIAAKQLILCGVDGVLHVLPVPTATTETGQRKKRQRVELVVKR